MASQIGLLRSVLTLDSAGFRQGFERAQASMMTFQKRVRRMEFKMKRFGRNMESIGNSMTIGITLPIVGAATAAVRSAAEFESLAVQMEVLTGSAEEGARAFEQLKRFSARTPFQLADLTKAQNTLMGFGAETQEAFEHLQMLGDIAAVTGGDLQAITVAFGQARAEGKLMTRDIRQLINQGVPAIDLLADSMGVATSEVLDMASQGKITFDVLVEAIQKATSEGGKFANGADRLASTLMGIFSTLKDNINLTFGELGQTISETLNLKEVGKNLSIGIQTITDMFKAMSDDSRVQMLKIAGLLAISGPVAIAMGKFVSMLAGFVRFVRKSMVILLGIFKSTFARIAAAFLFGITLGQGLIDVFKGIQREGKTFGEVLMNTMKAAVGSVFGPIVDLAEDGLGALVEGIDEVTGLNSALDEFWQTFEKNSKKAKETTEELGNSLKDTSMDLIRFLRLQRQVDETRTKGVGGGTGIPGFDLSKMKATRQEFKKMSEVSKLALGLIPGQAGEAKDAIEGMTVSSIRNLGDFKEFMKGFGEQFKSLIANQISASVISFGETIGTTLAGVENNFMTTFESIAVIFLDFAKQIAKLASAIGAILLFIPGGQGAGIGLLAGAAAVTAAATGIEQGIKKRAGNRQQRAREMMGLASGGLAFGPTPAIVGDNPNARSNPEVIAPLDKLKNMIGGGQNVHHTGEFRVKGTDLVLVLEHAKQTLQ